VVSDPHLLRSRGQLVLRMACVNVASLLPGACGLREREMAMRVARGAGRGRLVRHAVRRRRVGALRGTLGVRLAAVGIPRCDVLGRAVGRGEEVQSIGGS